MSLFQCREWWGHRPDTSEECDQGCLLVSDIDNSGDEKNLKVVTGNFKGILRIFAPRQRGFRAADLRLEKDLGEPILQIAAGQFISSTAETALAVLHPRRLVVYSVRATAGGFTQKQTKDDVFYSLDQMYVHRLTRTACNMCWGAFGGQRAGGLSGPKGDSICVQSMDGQIYVLEQETFAFARYLNNFLLPGPLAYMKEIDSIVTVNSQMQVECYRYRTLGTTMAGREKSHAGEKDGETILEDGPGRIGGSRGNDGDKDRIGLKSSRSKIRTVWNYDLGEHSVGLGILRMSKIHKTTGASSSEGDESGREITVLGEHTIFSLSQQGKMRSQRRLGYVPACFTWFPAGGGKSLDGDGKERAQKEHLAVATASRTVMVYDEEKLLWAAQTPFVPVDIKVGTFGGIRGMMVMMSEEGQIAITYLGTEPISQIARVPETRELDYESMDQEHKALLKVIRDSANSQLSEPMDKLQIICQAPHTLTDKHDFRFDKEEAEDVATNEQGIPICVIVKLLLRYEGGGVVRNVTINLNTPNAIKLASKTIKVPQVEGDATIEIPFFVSRSVLPSSSKIEGVAAYTSPGGAPRTTWLSFSMPLCLICRVVAPVNVANHRITLESNIPSAPLSVLFGEIFRSAAALQPELKDTGEKVLSLKFFAGPVVTIRLSKAKNKIRIQSVSFESLWLVTNQYVRRLHSFHQKDRKSAGGKDGSSGANDDSSGGTGPLILTFPDVLPLKQYFGLIDNHFNLRLQIMTVEHALDGAAHQFRSIQKRLLQRYRHKNPTALMDLDLLLHESFMRLNALSNRMLNCKKQLEVACSNLSCATHLILLLIRFKFGLDSKNAYLMEAFLSPIVADDTDAQGWEERTKAAMLHLLRSVLVKQSRGSKSTQFPQSQMTLMDDTSKLKSNIQQVCERLSKGYRLYRSTTNNKKKEFSTTPKASSPPSRPTERKA